MTRMNLDVAGIRRWHMLEGEALRVLESLPDASIDALISDPPYSSGGAFRGDRMQTTTEKYVQNRVKLRRPDFAGDNRDQRSFFAWATFWLSECLRIAKPGAPVCLFSDWRQLPTVTDALQSGGWIWRGIVPWDKTTGCRPQKGRFAAQAEYVVWGSNGAMPENRGVGCLPGVVREFPKPSAKFHIAGKPVAMMRELVKIAAPNALVLDPFAGSGSTGVACLHEGRRFLGVERVPEYADIARRRLAEVDAEREHAAPEAQGGLFEPYQGER